MTELDHATVLDALDTASECLRDIAANCPDCDASPADLCDSCDSRLARAAGFDRLAETLRRQP